MPAGKAASDLALTETGAQLASALIFADAALLQEPLEARHHDVALGIELAINQVTTLTSATIGASSIQHRPVNLRGALERAWTAAHGLPPMVEGEHPTAELVTELADLIRAAGRDD